MKKNILANFIGRFWSILSNFLFIPLYIHYLGFESYSVISFTLMIAGIMAVLDSGLTATLSREFARKDNNTAEKVKVYKNLETLYFIIVGICILIIFLSSSFIAEKWLNIQTYSPDQISFFLKIISFEIGFQLLFRFYMGGLLGLEKQVAANIFQVGWGVFRNGLVVIAIVYFPTLEVFFTWQVVSTIVFTIITKIFLDKIVLGKYTLNFNFKIEKEIISKIWKFASGMLLIALVSAFNTQMDKLAISKLLSIENLGYYTLAVSLSQGLIILVNPIATALLPRFTAHFSANENIEAKNLIVKTSILVSVLVFSIMMVLSFFAKDLIWVWTGNLELASKTFMLIPIVALAYAMFALQLLPYNVAIANGYTKLNNIIGITSLLITVPGYFFATKYYGAIGAAAVFSGVQVISTFIYIFFINRKFIKSNIIKDIYWKQYVLPFITAGIMAFLFSKIPVFTDGNRIFSLFWIGFVTFATLTVTLVIIVPFREIKNLVSFRRQ
jgi:O-antigen/teichoic acid export membrane protein